MFWRTERVDGDTFVLNDINTCTGRIHLNRFTQTRRYVEDDYDCDCIMFKKKDIAPECFHIKFVKNMVTTYNNNQDLLLKTENTTLFNLKLIEARSHTNEPVVILHDGKQKKISVMAEGDVENLAIIKFSSEFRIFCSSENCRGKKGTIRKFKRTNNADACVHICTLGKHRDVWQHLIPYDAEINENSTTPIVRFCSFIKRKNLYDDGDSCWTYDISLYEKFVR